MLEPSVSQEFLPAKDDVFAISRFQSDQVRLTIINDTGKNIVVFIFGCEFAFPEGKSESNGWYQLYLPSGNTDYISQFPGTHGFHLFFVKGKCDAEPIRLKALDVFQGRYPIVKFHTDRQNQYSATLTFGNEGNEL